MNWDTPPLSGGRALAYAVVAAIGGIASAFVVPLVALLFLSGTLNAASLTWRATALLVLTDIGFGIAVAFYLWARGLDLSFVSVRLPSLDDVGWAVGGYVASLALAIASTVVVSYFQVQPAQNDVAQTGQQAPTFLLVLIPLAFFFIGPAEELLFRGIVQRTLREAFSPLVAIPVAAIIFAGIHFFALSGAVGARFVTIGVLFLPALVLGTVYEKTENIVPSAVMHGAYDATLMGLMYLSLQSSGGSASAVLASLAAFHV